jgi:hypothetical protein
MGGTNEPPVRGLGSQPFQGGEEVSLAYEEVELSMLHHLIIDLLVIYTFQSLLQLKASPFRAGGGQSGTRIKLSKKYEDD